MGYKHCDCGGCFEEIVDAAMCDGCEEAGCSSDSTECKREDLDVGEFEGEDPSAVSRFLGFELAPQT